MFLVDTSAWIRHFGRNDPFDLRDLCSPDERVLCLPVYEEILEGIRDESAYRRIRDILDAAVWVEDPLGRARLPLLPHSSPEGTIPLALEHSQPGGATR